METLTCFQKVQVYISTLLLFVGYFYSIGVLSRLKKPMAISLDLSSTFLGELDAFLSVGIALGGAYTALFPLKKPILNIFIITLLGILTIYFEIVAINFSKFWMKIFFNISRTVYGFSFSTTIILQSVIYQYYNKQQQQKLIHIWNAIGALGDLFGVLMAQLLLSKLSLTWEYAMIISFLLNILFCCYLLVAVKQVPLANNEQALSVCQAIQECKEIVIEHLKRKRNILHSICLILLNCLYYMMLLWLPYFFLGLGFKQNATYISMIYPVAFVLGAFIIHPLKQYTAKHYGTLFFIQMVLFTISLIVLQFIGDDSSNIPVYFVLIFFSGLLTSGFSTYCLTTDLKNRTNGPRQYITLSSVFRIVIGLLQALGLLTSGILIQNDSRGFIKAEIAIGVTCAILLIYTLYLNPDSYEPPVQQKKENKFEEIQNEQSNKLGE